MKCIVFVEFENNLKIENALFWIQTLTLFLECKEMNMALI